MVVFNLFFFVCGLAPSLAWDYAPGVPQGEEAEKRVPWSEKPIGSLVYKYLLRRPAPHPCAIYTPQGNVGDTSAETASPTNTGQEEKSTSDQLSSQLGSTVLPIHSRPSSIAQSSSNPLLKKSLRTLSLVFSPVNLVIFISLCIALVQPLKAFFVDVSAEGGPSWKGPDGKPPLAFLIDTGSVNIITVKLE